MGWGHQPNAPAASTPGKGPVPIVQETRWSPGPVWKGEKSRPHRNSIPDRPALSQSLYRLSYQVHRILKVKKIFKITIKTQQQCINISILLWQHVLVLLDYLQASIQRYEVLSVYIMYYGIPPCR